MNTAGPALDRLALQRVVAVARPDAVRVLEHPEVDPTAARGAALDLHARDAASAARRAGDRARRSGRGRRDGCRAGDRGLRSRLWSHLRKPIGYSVSSASRRSEQVGPRLGVREVDHHLVARGDEGSGLRGEDPVRVRAVEVGVGVDHLRLDPQPEHHPVVDDVVVNGCSPSGHTSSSTYQSPRPAESSRRCLNHPSSRTKSSTPRLDGVLRQLLQPPEVLVEVDRLPGVEEQLARAVRARVVRAGTAGSGGRPG